MTKDEFKILWTNRYSKSAPISYTFRHDYPDRWLRIHSLPESKRYPENNQEWDILLARQNSIITDILGDNSKILVLTGDYYFEGQTELHPIDDVDSIKHLSFTRLDNIDLHKLWPEQYDQGQVYQPMFCNSIWSINKFDNILKDIAIDAIRVFFISTYNDIMIIPYDGGVDFILQDQEIRDKTKAKYRDWLSDRGDGL